MRKRITQEQLDLLKSLNDSATAEPWRLDEYNLFVFSPNENMVCEIRGFGGGLPQEANGKLIVELRNLLSSLISEIQGCRDREANMDKEIKDALNKERDECIAIAQMAQNIHQRCNDEVAATAVRYVKLKIHERRKLKGDQQ
jgi:hypothetical protein